MAISRVHTWSAGEVLLASDLNAEFSNILNNGSDLVSPFTKAISLGGFALNFDAANTIALTATTSGVILTGGTIREPAEDTITAFATGGQTNATALSAAKKFHRISVCATTADSYKLPTSTAGQCHYVRNDGATAAQAFGAGTDTVNGVATATGIPHPVGLGIWYVCTTAGNWTTGPLVAVSGNFPVTLTATAATGVTLPTTGTLATLAGSEEFTNKTLTSSVGKGTWTASGTWTLPAWTAGGTISGGGNQLNNIIIGTVTPLAGAFTTLSSTGLSTLASISCAGSASMGSIAGTAVATQSDQETATSTTTAVSPGRQQFHPSSSKVWIRVTFPAGTPTSQGAYNVSSLTDNGVGTTQINFTTAFSGAGAYASVACQESDGTPLVGGGAGTKNTGNETVISRTTAFIAADVTFCYMAFGDQ